MESVPYNPLLPVPAHALHDIRKMHNLDQPGRMEEAVKILREWLQKQQHIVKKDLSDEYLEKTLISCKGSVEKSKHQLDRLSTMKTIIPKFFSKFYLKSELKDILEIAWFAPLPKMTKDLYRVVVIRISDKPYTAESFMHFFQYCIMSVEYIKAHDYANGFIVIYDYTKINVMELMAKLNITELQQFVTLLIDGYGARLKAVHIMTESKAIELLIKTIKQFVSAKIGDRMQVQLSLDDLHKVVPKDLLPEEYGGTEGPIEKVHNAWVEALSSEQHVEYLKMMSKACTDESLRPSGKLNEEYLGMPGSFRHLSVD